jgi:hypothetical protein
MADDVLVNADVVPEEAAPFGWTVDRDSGERRPKKSPGRPKGVPNRPKVDLPHGKSPSLEDIKAAGAPIVEPDQDRAPGKAKRSWRAAGTVKEAPEIPPFRAGPIAKGMNRLYARTAKIVKVMDPAIGAAILSTTRKDDDDDITVGEAWEELAKTNPRIRLFLLRLIAGGAWGQLLMVHAPIFMAILLKDGIRQHIPFMAMVEAMLSNEDDYEAQDQTLDVSAMLGGLRPEDAQQMAAMAQQMMANMAGNMTSNLPRQPSQQDISYQAEAFDQDSA